MSDANVRWHLLQIKKAGDRKELEDCAFEIDYDIWEDMEWTLDKSNVNRVRNYFAFRCMTLGIKTSEVSEHNG